MGACVWSASQKGRGSTEDAEIAAALVLQCLLQWASLLLRGPLACPCLHSTKSGCPLTPGGLLQWHNCGEYCLWLQHTPQPGGAGGGCSGSQRPLLHRESPGRLQHTGARLYLIMGLKACMAA